MNTKNTIRLAFMLLAVMISACKNKSVDYSLFEIQDEYIQAESTNAVITGTYSFDGEVNGMKFNLGLDKKLTDAVSTPMYLEGCDFSVSIDGMKPGTMYYYCYSVDFGLKNEYLTKIDSFMTLQGIPAVETIEAIAAGESSCQVKCKVTSDGGADIAERGIYWNTTGEPGINDHKVKHAENGLGDYLCRLEGLEPNTIYFIRAYASNIKGIGLGNVVEFQTGNSTELPTVATKQVVEITQTTALCGGKIVNEGSSPVTQCGICWGTSPNPIVEGEHIPSHSNEDDFSVDLSGLSPGTTYYVCAYATNGEGTGYGEIIDFSTFSPNLFNISVSCSPIEGGHAEGGGAFAGGVEHQVKATANTHYDFNNWTENGNVVSTNANYTFTVTGNRNLVANFTIKQYHIEATSEPSNGGIIIGNGNYNYGQTCTLTATANEGYVFEKWTENGIGIPNGQSTYEFTVTGPRTLVAHFSALPQIPEGAIDALFSVSPSLQVYFSQGNLQYKASTQTWRFAENQWDYVGGTTYQGQGCGTVYENGVQCDNTQISQSYSGWIDLFGWGTGNDPTKTNLIYENYNEFYEWGDNPISNGGNVAGLWRTLTKDEWNYVFYTRQASTVNGTPNARFMKAIVNNVKGVILFPDSYSHPSDVHPYPENINKDEVDFLISYSSSDWHSMQENGCVFLPVTGLRQGLAFGSFEEGRFWSSTSNGDVNRFGLRFTSEMLKPDYGTSAFLGESVRLVHEHH